MAAWKNRWPGATALCVGSGPSLTPEDLDLARAWRDGGSRYVIVCNSTFRTAPWADVVVGHDRAWWKVYHEEVRKTFDGRAVAWTPIANDWCDDRIERRELDPLGNTGAAAIQLAVHAGCRRVLMLGYDCSRGPDGQVHHHPDHPKGFTNGVSMPRWPRLFARAAENAAVRGVEVLNCSRHTVLTCFPTMALEEALTCSSATSTAV